MTLGAQTAEIAENARIGVVLRVAVLGDEQAGPEHHAAVLARKPDRGEGRRTDKKGISAAAGDSGGTGGAGWTGVAAAARAGAMVVTAGLVFVRSRRRSATQTTRGSAR
ncbi:hypothetical protein [Streptomyces sp. NPDC051286]|uniref:hypothetical protein n=1 Tax=Streptomyces sp. NPDC051286 TaxID=3365647 RepID=UPI0037873F6F